NAFALFLKSQRKWESPPLQEEHVSQFKSFCKDHKFDAERHIVPHGSYLVNLAQADTAKAKQAYESFLDDVKRCEALGIKLYNFHPGNTGPSPRPEAIARIAGQLNRVHQNSSGVVTLLETMAGGGNVIGSTFEDLRDIIALIDDKSRVGVCLDTCHIFAAGYEVRDKTAFEGTMSSFADIIGLKYLRAVHLNDSKAPFGSHRDLHANIGTGFLGLRSFHYIMNSPLFHNMPMVLETPISAKDSSGKEIEDKGIWAREIKTLESLIDMDMDGNEFRDMEERLWKSGSDERARIQAQVDKKLEKDKLKAVKSSKAGKSKPVARRKTAKQQAESSDSELSPNDSSEN
ncbi:DNA-lyase, partial [Xylona heveae TC161]